ncbi:MAG TPA: DUF2934 domain-containing protein [Polyangiaceae bacterium]|nr:DUF2934 domain-containing protein [Polyangiaceae bacterium]
MTEALGIDAQAISRRAHELWLKRGCPSGTPELDWQEAERQLRAEALLPAGEPVAPILARDEARPTVASGRSSTAGQQGVPQVPRPRAPRSIVTRSGHAPAARLLVALVPDAHPDRAVANGGRAPRR